ncbi:hypothetical protein CWB76_10665 [Pseudoalteromonas sp. S1609]|uniref:hypothetical protein n=1 Tax=Pseudoalteromonas sp. S1609 TaxID=579505 RepID=UPI00110A5E16|nr:hypothetical protein [Pseudoalteromonas sp. S1609]TMP70402.1 hypothetical protein CWB76_10665 [Pseudoalteromonas sp. S1609]
MKVLINYFDVAGTSSYPDEYTLFLNMEKVLFNNKEFWLCDYKGSKPISSLETEAYLASIDPANKQLIPVIIDNVAGQLDDYINVENEYTVPQASDGVIATGQLAIPDRKFKVPFKRVDTGRVQLMPAEVVSGVFTLPLKFETNGVWIVNQALINSDYEQDVFALTERRFSVI